MNGKSDLRLKKLPSGRRIFPCTVALLMICLLHGFQAVEGAIKDHAIPKAGHQFEYPRDFGSHPEFKIEWWYITGHLTSEDGHRYGYQATFFRLSPDPEAPTNSYQHASRDLHLAHMALLDLKNKTFSHQERLQRSPWMAFAKTGDMDLKNGNWKLRRLEGIKTPEFELKGSILADVSLDLKLAAVKPLTLFGENGYSRKGADPKAASYYMTFTRLQTTGTLRLKGKSFQVQGWSWMDHEVSSSQLEQDQVGWDWISIRLNDGRDIMAYRMRTSDEKADPYSTVAWVDIKGNASHQPLQDDMWRVVRRWTSPETKNTYPIEIELSLPDQKENTVFRAHLVPLFDNQEMLGHISGIEYWEGACEVLDPEGNQIGEAYMELTGYGGESDLSALK
jgi:predicted secreted hydrolase